MRKTRARLADRIRTNRVLALGLCGLATALSGCARTHAPVPPESESATARTCSLVVAALRCESRAEPLDVDTPTPRLGWILDSDRRGARQSAYRVLVASAPERLTPDRADRWDSGRVTSSRSVLVPYAGRALRSDERVYWQVRAWDADGHPSAWSAPATWTMGIVDPADWRARWIGFERATPELPSLEGAQWIWDPEREDELDARPGTRLFWRSFEVPDEALASATIVLTADNEYELLVNDLRIGGATDWRRALAYDVGQAMRAGARNKILVRVTNGGTGPNPAGLIARLTVETQGGNEITLVTDGTWEASWPPEEGREGGSAEIRPVRVLGSFGCAPWGAVPVVTNAARGAPIARHEFAVRKDLRRALVHVAGLGHHVLQVNGERVGSDFLDPAWSVYEKTVYYTTHDITDLLTEGRNAFGVLLGKGFYNTEGDRRIHGVNADRPLVLLLQADLEYADGRRETVKTDASWRWTPGPYTHDAILGGCDYDARRLPAGWSAPGFDDARWNAAAESEGPGGELIAQESPPMRVRETFRPVAVQEPEPGRFVYDFGQNASATPRLRVRGGAGQTIRLTHAEQRHGQSPGRNDGDGLVNQAGIGTPSFVTYTLRGDGEEEWSPDFFYSGYQYVEVSGAVHAGRPNPDARPEIIELASLHVRSGAETIGSFACSNELFNRIDRLVDWAVKSNLGHVLTDCPHREKLGWLEVSYLMGPSIAHRNDLSRLFPKIARDIRDSQAPDGTAFTVAPNYPAFQGGFRYTTEWGAASVFVPWLAYRWYGDERILAESWSSMAGFVDNLVQRAGDDLLLPAEGLGDWYDYGHGEGPGASRFTPVDLTATATFALCLDTLIAAGERIERPAKDLAWYRELAAQLREEYRARHFDGSSFQFTNWGSPQTANAMSLVAGLVDPMEEQGVVDAIVEDVVARGNQQTSGDIGFRYLLRALADHDRSRVIHAMIDRTSLGSYGGIVEAGWTSMPESWDANPRVSMQHCMLGHVLEWFQSDVAGLRLDPEVPAFRTFHVAPHPVGDLTWARTNHRSPYGEIAVEWRRDGRSFELDIVVPVNTTAIVHLPPHDPDSVFEGSTEVKSAEGVTSLDDGNYGAGAGTYHFRCRLEP